MYMYIIGFIYNICNLPVLNRAGYDVDKVGCVVN